jgi:hypothetical protein
MIGVRVARETALARTLTSVVSVNVGMPNDVDWHARASRQHPELRARGPRIVRCLNIGATDKATPRGHRPSFWTCSVEQSRRTNEVSEQDVP